MVGEIKRAWIVASVCTLVLCACAGGTEPGQTHDEFTLPEETDAPAKSLGSTSRTLTGFLGFDDIEGGCGFLEAEDGTRYEVTYPAGWELDRRSGELRSDDGRVVRAGDQVTVRGAVATDRSSVCQIGPIFVATDVEAPER